MTPLIIRLNKISSYQDITTSITSNHYFIMTTSRCNKNIFLYSRTNRYNYSRNRYYR